MGCQIDGCGRPVKCRGMCNAHYVRHMNEVHSTRFSAVCPTCNQTFFSRRPKKFCGLRCYVNSSQFKEHSVGNFERINRSRVARGAPDEPLPCVHCGKPLPNRKVSRKYCNQRCYRAFMAGRFDRWIANPQTLALPQAYDEFLSQSELPCLVEGCDWVGKQLSNHMNSAHGVRARDFKMLAGFNLTTGVVSAETAEALASRSHIHDAPGVRQPNTKGKQGTYKSLEGREHSLKSRSIADFSEANIRNSQRLSTPEAKQAMRELIARTRANQPERRSTCLQCEKTFTYRNMKAPKYCGESCQHLARLHRNRTEPWHPLPCAQCGQSFMATRNVVRMRRWANNEVFCSEDCRLARKLVVA